MTRDDRPEPAETARPAEAAEPAEAADAADAEAPEPGSPRWWQARAAIDARRRPRPGGLSTGRIVEAALEVLREEGIEAMTLRAVAARLGTGSNASIYRHVAGRDELLVLIIDHLMGEIRLERAGRGWRVDAEAAVWELRRVFLRHPLPPLVTRGRSPFGPNMLRVMNGVLDIMLEAGLGEQQAVLAVDTLLGFVAHSAMIERSGLRVRQGKALLAREFGDLVTGLPPEDTGALRSVGRHYVTVTDEQSFANGMRLILDGIAAQVDRAP